MKPILMIALVAAAVSVSSEAAPAPWLPIPANTPRHLPMFGLPRHLPTYGLTPQNLSTTGGVTAPSPTPEATAAAAIAIGGYKPTIRQIVAHAKKAMVWITTLDSNNREIAHGTGFSSMISAACLPTIT